MLKPIIKSINFSKYSTPTKLTAVNRQYLGGFMLRKFLVFIFFLCPAILKGVIVESPKFAEIEKYAMNNLPEKVVIVCDIDNTVLRATQNLGSVAWGDHTISELINKGISKEDAEEIESILWKTVQPFVKVESVDPETPIILEGIQNKGFLVFGLTARCPAEADYTNQQLLSIGINFARLKPQLTFESLSKETKQPLYTYGILFGTPFNRKSQILFSFLDENKIFPKCIIFIDDKLSHIEDISKVCCDRNISFCGIRFSGADQYVKSFNHQVANIQWILFPSIVSDKQAEQILISQQNVKN